MVTEATIVHEGGTATVTGFDAITQRFTDQQYPILRVWYTPPNEDVLENMYNEYRGATITAVIQE